MIPNEALTWAIIFAAWGWLFWLFPIASVMR